MLISLKPPSVDLLTTTRIVSWIIEVYLQDGVLAQNISISSASINMTLLINLVPGTFYMIQVAGVNTRGIGNFSVSAGFIVPKGSQ